MSALTDLKAKITAPDGSLRDRGTIAAALEQAITDEAERLTVFAPEAILVDRNQIEACVLRVYQMTASRDIHNAVGLLWIDITKLPAAQMTASNNGLRRDLSAEDRLRQLAEWAEKERDSTNIAFYHERYTYDTVAKRARAFLDTLYGKEAAR